MSEIRIPTTAPPAGGSTAGSGGTAAGAGAVPIGPPPQPVTPVAPPPPHNAPAVSLGGSLAGLTEGARIEGVVIGEDDSGHPVLRTAAGSYILDIEGDLAPAQYARLVLQVLSTVNGLRAAVVSADGVALQPPVAVRLSPDPAAAAATLPLPAGAAATPSTVIATVIAEPAAGAGPTAPGNPAPLPGGAVLVVRMVPTAGGPGTPPERLAGGGTPLPSPTNTASLASGTASPTSGTAAAAVAAASASTATTAGSGAAAAAPATATALGAEAALRGVIAGTAIGEATGGRPLVRTPVGLLAIETPTPLHPGDRVSFEIVSLRLPSGPALPPLLATRPDSPAHLLADWASLREAVEVLRSVDPALTQRLLDTVMPRPGTSQFTSSMLFFLAALRGGDIAAWLGKDAANRLDQAGRGEVARRLADEAGQLARLSPETDGAWRAMPIPVFDGRAIQQVMLFTRRQRSRDERRGNRDQTRFLLDLELSAGAVQLDGLLAPRQFDLIIRTRMTLPGSMRRDIGGIFNGALGATGYQGSLAFQVTRQFPVNPLEDLQGHRQGARITV